MKFETLCLHGGQEPDPTTLSRAVPLHRTSSYLFKNTEHAAALFGLRELGNIYTRLMNPTHDVLEKRVAALDGAAGALAVASGTSAIFYSVVNLCRAGDEIVSANNLYGGTYTQFNDILPQFGIRVRFVDPDDASAVRAAINDKTRAVFCESIGNPSLSVADISGLAAIAHEHRLPLIVDGTFTTPALQRAMDHGADIVVYSLTKWMGGHGTGIGGIVVDSGRFDWKSGPFPLMNEPEPSYHGIRWAHDLPEPLAPLAYLLRMRLVPLRNLGACISPDNAWLFLQGLETLPLRMERHCSNAEAVARHLASHPAVEWVRYPLLDQPQRCQQYLSGTGGSVVVFGIRGGAPAGSAFIDHLKLISHLANVGDAKSLAIHPASTTHSQLDEAQQAAGGITPELIRLSIGLEHIDDILNDIDQALSAARL